MFSLTSFTANICEIQTFDAKDREECYFTEEDIQKLLDHFETISNGITVKRANSKVTVEHIILDGYRDYVGMSMGNFIKKLNQFATKKDIRQIMKPDFTVVDATTIDKIRPFNCPYCDIGVKRTLVKDLISYPEELKRCMLLQQQKARSELKKDIRQLIEPCTLLQPQNAKEEVATEVAVVADDIEEVAVVADDIEEVAVVADDIEEVAKVFTEMIAIEEANASDEYDYCDAEI